MVTLEQTLRARYANLPLQSLLDALKRSKDKQETVVLSVLTEEIKRLYFRKDWPAIQERVQRMLDAGLASSESTLSYQSGRRERKAYFKKYDAERALLKKMVEAADANC